MNEQTLTIDDAPSPPKRRRQNNRWLVIAVSAVAVASILVLGLMIMTVLRSGSEPINDIARRDVVEAEADVKANPKDFDLRLKAADANLGAQEWDRAISHLDSALVLRPKDPGALLVKSQAYLGKGDIKTGRKILEDLRVGNGPGSKIYGEASIILATLDAQAGDLEAAVKDLEEAVKYESTDSTLLVALAAAQTRVGKKDDAVNSYAEALRFVPDMQEALDGLQGMNYGPAGYVLAQRAWAAGLKDEAGRFMEQAAKDSPQLVWIQVALGDFRILIGNTEGAKAAYEAALALDPNDKDAAAGLASLK